MHHELPELFQHLHQAADRVLSTSQQENNVIQMRCQGELDLLLGYQPIFYIWHQFEQLIYLHVDELYDEVDKAIENEDFDDASLLEARAEILFEQAEAISAVIMELSQWIRKKSNLCLDKLRNLVAKLLG